MESQINKIMQNKHLESSSEEQPSNSIIIMVNTVPTGGFPPVYICHKDTVTLRNFGFNTFDKFNIKQILEERKNKKPTPAPKPE